MVKDIAIFAAEINSHYFSISWIGLPSQFCECNSHKLCKLVQGKFAVGQGKSRENTGNLKIQFEWILCNSEQILGVLLINRPFWPTSPIPGPLTGGPMSRVDFKKC